MNNWCFAGPIVNWEFGIEKAVWATNDQFHHYKWFKEMLPDDNVIIFVTGIGVVGYCNIKNTGNKTALWWQDEIKENYNKYPYVIYLEKFTVVSNIRNQDKLRKLSLNSNEWRNCGLTQRHIIGGVNKVNNYTIFENIKDTLQRKLKGSLITYTPKEHEKISQGVRDAKNNLDKSNLSENHEFEIDQDLNAPPEKRTTVVEFWQRNRSIILERKRQSSNRCEIPGCNYVPFKKISEEEYSEAHHIIPLGQPGSDRIENIVILCPNHHREVHYGNDKQKLTIICKELRGLK